MAAHRLRNLNDYESMLATMTCNVGMSLSIPLEGGRRETMADVDAWLRLAWSKCVDERLLLQVKVVPRTNQMGPLGQRYTLEAITVDHSSLFVIRHGPIMPDLHQKLQTIGTTALDISKGSYFVSCFVVEKETEELSIQVIICLCHSLSDGPGALRVAQSFLQYFGQVIFRDDGATKHAILSDPQPLTDLQALILGSDYAVGQDSKPVFKGQDEFAKALASKPIKTNKNTALLPPEPMQQLPLDDGFGGPSFIDCVHFTLSAQETSALRDACRQHGTTVQGALTAVAVKTRVELLGLKPPVDAAVQAPVNTRSIADIDQDECLCGSAGVWYVARLEPNEDLFALAQRATNAVRDGLQDDGRQPREWLRRLFHSPSTLPPYSLMVSSIGVAPIEVAYGQVTVEQLFFFGGALRTETPSKAQATMIHAVTFRDELTCIINYTSPGISKNFMEDTANMLKATLIFMATHVDKRVRARLPSPSIVRSTLDHSQCSDAM